MIYEIGNKLEERAQAPEGAKTVAALTEEEIPTAQLPEFMDPAELPSRNTRFCKAEVRHGLLVGAFCVPAREDRKEKAVFSYGIWRDGVLFLDDSGLAEGCLKKIRDSKSWKSPGVGRFFYDFLETLIEGDLRRLEELEDRVSRMEDAVLSGSMENFNHRMIAFRKEVTAFSHYYSQLADLGAEMQENENGFFTPEEVGLFRLFTDRVARLREETQMLREYSIQVREFYQTQMDLRQNKIMKVLTVVTTIFLPLSLIVGWYGMNFPMPEFDWAFGYPAVILLSAAVVIFCVWLFKRKKFL